MLIAEEDIVYELECRGYSLVVSYTLRKVK